MVDSPNFFFSLRHQSGERGPDAEHHFSAECHGKDLPDACNAIIKQKFKREEWYGNAYFPDTKSLYDWCIDNLENSGGEKDEEYAGRKICRQIFWYIKHGEVDHAPLYEVSNVPGSASNFSFVPMTRPGEAGMVKMRVASCVCIKCEEGKPDECENIEFIPPPQRVLVSRSQMNTAQRLDLRKELLTKGIAELRKKRVGDPLIIYIANESRREELGGVGRWFIAELLTLGVVNKSQSKTASRGGDLVGVIFPKEREPESIFEFEHDAELCLDSLGDYTEMCKCGPAVGCFKRHIQYVPVTAIRETPDSLKHPLWFVEHVHDESSSGSKRGVGGRISSRTRQQKRVLKEKDQENHKVIPKTAVVVPALKQHVLNELAYWDNKCSGDRRLLETLSY